MQLLENPLRNFEEMEDLFATARVSPHGARGSAGWHRPSSSSRSVPHGFSHLVFGVNLGMHHAGVEESLLRSSWRQAVPCSC